MSLPPPPQDPQGAPGGGFGPPQGFGPPAAAGGFGPPGGAPGGYGPGGYGPPPGGPGMPPYGMPPQPPGGGNRGAKVAAIVVGSVLAAALAVGGVVLWAGGNDEGDSSAEAAPGASPDATSDAEPDAGGDAEPTGRPSTEDTAPDTSSSTDPGSSPTSTPGGMVPYVVLDPGECFDHPSLNSDVTVVEKRSCDAPHNGEVIANETLTGSFADEKALRKKVLGLCEADATKRLARMPDDGRMYYFYAIYPSLPTYELRGDDTISCALTLSNAVDGQKLSAPLPD